MAKTYNLKPSPSAIEMKIFRGMKGPKVRYLVMKQRNSFHVFAEVEAKEAAVDCGCPLGKKGHNPATTWGERWQNATRN